MKKIVHLIDSLGIGGAQTHLLTILKCADRERYFHAVYSLTDALDTGREIENLGIKVASLNLNAFLKEKKWIATIRAISKMLKDEKPDILETHLTWSRIFGTMAFLAVGKRKVISFEHGDIYNTGRQYKTANFLVSFFIDVIVVPSNAIKEWICKNYGISQHKIEVMHNSVLTEHFKPQGDRENSGKILGAGESEIVVGSVGTLGTGIDKGMNYCIDAMSELAKKYKAIKLLIIGDGELRGKLERQVRDLALENVVSFLGFRRDISSILNAIDIFVSASPFEPCAIAIIEAMSMERPVVGSASGGTPELVEDGVTGFLFIPRDSKDLSEKIDKLIKDDRLRREMGARARRRVEEKFEARKYTKRLETIYASLLGLED